jgi:hypothetical protein
MLISQDTRKAPVAFRRNFIDKARQEISEGWKARQKILSRALAKMVALRFLHHSLHPVSTLHLFHWPPL